MMNHVDDEESTWERDIETFLRMRCFYRLPLRCSLMFCPDKCFLAATESGMTIEQLTEEYTELICTFDTLDRQDCGSYLLN